MNNYFLPRLIALILFVSAFTTNGMAQDSLKKAVTAKKRVVTTTTQKASVPTAATGIPINPKTGRPYTKYGYGAYAKNKYDATKAARKADSLKKAAAKPVTNTTVAAPIASAPPIATVPAVTAPPVDKSLNAQYQYLLTKVYNYQQPFVAALWKNVMDTLNTNRRKLKDVQATVTIQTKTITDLQADVASKEASLSASDTIDIAGVTLPKTTYNLIMWGLVIIFGAVAAVVIARSGSNKNEAAYRTQLYNELEEEFKTYKSKANEKEKKLARELQTERNKVDELMGRG
ncbi:MAG: hypothetical protein ABI367_11045 [Mucilaginibacter sp.]